MTIHDTTLARSHDDILEKIAAALDIPTSLYEKAVARYQSIGAWLDRPESELADYEPAISPQGSFVLGTVTRPLTNKDEYDVDVVCRLGATKADFTQKSLKKAVGREVELYANAHSMNEPVEERRRCWTLHYAEGAKFHMDILPALPDAERYRLLLEKRGYTGLARSSAATEQAIAITDNTSPAYDLVTVDWPQSNPAGYAVWFRKRMISQLTERRQMIAKTESANVEDIPDYKVKTPLQRAIQLLKRHRDCMFGDDEMKPISIIITTLAAHAYSEEPTIALALQSILSNMDRFIEAKDGQAYIANPVNPAENFADKWAEESRKSDNFYAWLDQARQDFGLYLRGSSYDAMPEELSKRLGETLIESVLKAVLPATVPGISAPAIARTADEDQTTARAQAAIEERERAGAQSKPWSAS